MKNVIYFMIQQLKGFTVKPCMLTNRSLVFVELSLRFSYFDLYEINSNRARKKLNISSSLELVSSFHNLTTMETRQQALKLYESFSSIFSNIFMNLELFGDCFISTNRLSRLVFKNATIESANYFKFTNTSIRRYYLEFVQNDDLFVDQRQSIELNCDLTSLTLTLAYNVAISEMLLDKIVYKSTRQIMLDGTVIKIDSFVFKHLNALNHLTLSLANFRQLWHSSNDNKWLEHLNANHRVPSPLNDWLTDLDRNRTNHLIRSKFVLSMDDQNDQYEYPNEDICLFRHFPHNNLVFYEILVDSIRGNVKRADFIEKDRISVKTCTLYHLIRFSWMLKNMSINLNLNQHYYVMINDLNCTGQMLDNCETRREMRASKRFTQDDMTYYFEWFQFIGPVVLFPIVASIGLISNALIIFTIKSKKNRSLFNENENCKRMFDYIQTNSAFNIIECFLSLFTLMSECLGLNSIYCSTVMTSKYVQLFKIYVVNYFGEVMKTSSVLTMLLFSLERYKITKNSGSQCKWLLKLSKANLKVVTCLIVIISIVTSVNKIFEYNSTNVFKSQIETPSLFISEMLSSKADKLWFSIIYLFHYLLNDLVLLAANLVIDLLLVYEIKKDLSVKRKLLKKGDQHHQHHRHSTKDKRLMDNLDAISRTETNTNKMIIYSFVTYICCRFPELCLFVYFYLNYKDFLIFFTFGPIGINVVEFFYIISYITNIFFYFKFNKKFRDAFNILLFSKK